MELKEFLTLTTPMIRRYRFSELSEDDQRAYIEHHAHAVELILMAYPSASSLPEKPSTEDLDFKTTNRRITWH